MNKVDTISVTYNTLEETLDAQHRIEQKIQNFIDRRPIANRFESKIELDKLNKYHLTVDLIKD